MPSPPSSSTGSGKRKRTAAAGLGSAADPATAELLQPSSRDASGEDADDSAVTTNSSVAKHRKIASSTEVGNPPSKRARRSAAAADGGEQANAEPHDLGEPSDTTEASEDIANKSSLKKTAHKNGHDREDQQTMPPPGKGTFVHPVGYKTNSPPTDRPVRVYADGVFDLFHLGHMRQLEQAKTIFPNTYLIVGVTGDEETHRRKGLTVLSGDERAETIRHCKWVDEVIPNCPWILTPEFIEEHDIDYVAHDDLPYVATEGDDIYKPIKEQGKFLVTQRTEGVSTTGIITKIVRDYEQYITRQLKRGTSRKELNISWLKKNELDLKRHVIELRDQIRSNWQVTGTEVSKELRNFWQSSRPNSRNVSPARSFHRASVGASGDLDPNSPPPMSTPKSPSLFGRMSHLDVPSGEHRPSNDFAAGYSLGLVGGVRSWMTKSRVRESQPPSPSGSEGDGDSEAAAAVGSKSPLAGSSNHSNGNKKPASRGRSSVVGGSPG